MNVYWSKWTHRENVKNMKIGHWNWDIHVIKCLNSNDVSIFDDISMCHLNNDISERALHLNWRKLLTIQRYCAYLYSFLSHESSKQMNLNEQIRHHFSYVNVRIQLYWPEVLAQFAFHCGYQSKQNCSIIHDNHRE